jgi:hypothetical protein
MTEADSCGHEDTNMTYNICVPVYLGGEVVDNLVATIDVAPHHLILVDNTPDSYCKKFEGKGYTILYYPNNIGVGRAWNIGLQAQLDWTFLLTQAAVFPNGFSSFLLDVNGSDECYMTMEGWHVVGISKKVVDKIGLIDTNFWPGYLEDSDYYRRMRIAGVTHGALHVPEVSVPSIGTAVGAGAKVNLPKLMDYFIEKWGAGPNEDGYQLPFKDKPLDYFPNRSLAEVQRIYGL